MTANQYMQQHKRKQMTTIKKKKRDIKYQK